MEHGNLDSGLAREIDGCRVARIRVTRDADAGRWGEFSPYQQKQIAWAMKDWDPYPADKADRNLGQQILGTLFPDPSNVHIGHLQIGGGVVTTVREKNPFGLLNMEVFHVSY